ncbi:DUF2484 family protein [Leisingera aquaemixtae]|uniref:DUF2484 family protein n=1 Tax=Leisingera aquaemixtae TaxID=1396826 RepID=A0A0P1H5Y7_9RHOB|nr:DUF2484 family protein [Leisingera aquaemixtae]CUH98197.1 hypothetical protein PHA8399_00310 [Leisingera aquaemixtae]
MTLSLTLAAVWALAANILAMIPSRDGHWTRAYVLIGLWIPLLGYVTWENGPWWGLAVLLAGMSVLRWPVIYLGRYIRRSLRR